jgi:hypothetical protein
MVRVVGAGGIVAAYIWDMVGGGFPLDPILAEMRAMGLAPPRPPRVDASRMEVTCALAAAEHREAGSYSISSSASAMRVADVPKKTLSKCAQLSLSDRVVLGQ